MERDVYARLHKLESDHWWFVARRAILRHVISQRLFRSKPLRILEAGCGTGGNLKLLQEFGTVTAFEPDDEARALARQNDDADIRPGHLPDGVPGDRDQFDLVAAFDVLEHVEQDVESLHTLTSRLSPGGCVIITVPALAWLWSRHDETHHHYRRYSRAQLMELIDQAGLRPVTVTYFNTLLFPLIAGVRMINWLLGDRAGSDDRMPSGPVNSLLKAVFASERRLIGQVRLPIGVSLLAVAQRPAQ